MKTACFVLLRLVAGTYFVLTSIYCLLAYLPFTYVDVIKAPPYAWMPWFAHWHAVLYWPVLVVAILSCWESFGKKWFYVLFGILAASGIYIAIRPFLPFVQDNEQTWFWSWISLLPIAAIAVAEVGKNRFWKGESKQGKSLFEYSTAVQAAIVIAILYAGSSFFYRYSLTHSFVMFHARHDSELIGWSIVSHVAGALLVISTVNLIWLASARLSWRRAARGVLVAAGFTFFLYWQFVGFLRDSLSFEGWRAQIYAGALALTLILLAISLALPWLERQGDSVPKSHKYAIEGLCVALATVSFFFHELIGGADWNGVFQSTLTVLLWVAFGISFYIFRPRRRAYSTPAILGILIITVFAYKGMEATEIIWGGPLGSTDGSISESMDLYGTQDASFSLIHQLLSGEKRGNCGGLCRVLRQYTNIRGARVRDDLKLVEQFVPDRGPKPNIFIFVIDSLRPDYLGAYNLQVDFTPNLDAFAKESVVVQNVYTEYAGTSLSEPAIWSGSLLLHAHYQQPFHKLDSLEKLTQGDGYQMIVSWDDILRQILTPPSDLIKLDTDKPLWNNLEACSTIQELETTLDGRKAQTEPVFFYTQPKNIHQFANNHLPGRTSENWRLRRGFNDRIAYELNQVDSCFGGFSKYLKARGLYDNSIIIVTADHGDATGELGRTSHSLIIYPEVMRVPLIIHLPKSMQNEFVYDNSRISTLTDIAPSLYYLLGHRPIVHNPLFGRPLFMKTETELQSYKRSDVFFASDVRAAFGVLEDHGRFFYATYDSPPKSMLFDLEKDPKGTQNIVTDELKKKYDDLVIEHLQEIGDFYGYKPGVGSLLASNP